ncbi:MAG: transglutaminase domain-containing protein [Clostridia bacterium]|nr:transglutaminase domain-containing protein [Clostridia bacterium]
MNNTTTKRLKPILVNPQVTVDQKNANVGILLEILLLYTGLLGYIFCNTTALDMNIPAPALVAITALCFGLMILLVWFKRVFFGVLGGIAGISLLFYKVTFPMYAGLWNSLVVCYNYTIYLLGSQENYSNYLGYMTMDISNYLENPVTLQRNFYTAVILLSLIAALFFALALFRRIPIIISFIVPLVGLVPFFFYGIVPHYIAFSVFLSALIGCYGQSVVQHMGRRRNIKVKKGTNIRKKKETKRKKRTSPLTTGERFEFAANHGSFGVIITGVMLAVTVGTAAFIYSRPILQMDQVRASLDALGESIMNTVFQSTYEKNLNVGGYMAENELIGLQVPSWRRLKVATVRSTTDQPVYLRYRTAVDLTEDGWTLGDEEFITDLETNVDFDFVEYNQYYNYLRLTAPDGDPLAAGLDAVDSEEQGYINDHVTVYPKYKVSNILGLPEGTVTKEPVADYTEYDWEVDTLLLHDDTPRDRSYMFQVVSPVMTSNVYLTAFNNTQKEYLNMRGQHGENDPYMSREMAYSSFVYRQYLDLPEEVAATVSGLAHELTDQYKNKLEKVQAIERYFRENYTYSLTRQRLSREDGTAANAYDYITYFLFQNEKKEGYCTLFASSMVSMLRSLGMPARVATGYYATPFMIDTDSFATELVDSNYHAWVEVYFDGMGWIGFEPTPDFGGERNYYLLEALDRGEEIEEPVIEIVYEEIPGFIKYNNQVLPDPTEEEEEKEDPLTNAIVSALKLNSMSGVAKMILQVILVILIFFAVLFLGEFGHRSSVRGVLRGSPAEGVRRGYYLILRLMQLQGFKFFEGELLEDFARRSDNLKIAPEKLEPIVPILQKALYSQLPLTEEEREAVADYVFALDKVVFRRANPLKAFWYKLTLKVKPRHKAMIWDFS